MDSANHKIIGIIQARMGSTRFPRKMSANLGGYPIIDWVLRRSKRSKLIHNLVLATSTKTENDYLVERAEKYSINSYRGSENNVLSRFVEVADDEDADIIVRICADNPFICGSEIDRLVKFYLSSNCEYAFNHQNRLNCGYADGFGAEILSAELLRKIGKSAQEKKYREHVTLFIWDNQSSFKIKATPVPQELCYPKLRFDVDTIDDKDKLEILINNGISIESSAREIIEKYNYLRNIDTN